MYLAIGRELIEDTEELLGAEMVGLVLYITIPAVVCTGFACALARIILVPGNPRALTHAALLATSAFVVIACGWTAVLLVSGGADSPLKVSLAIVLYSSLTALGVFASPCFTFLMLRMAKYRFIMPGRSA
ncbi:MAG: hypothetical protein O3C40_26440 [Planctomycetota bacterium]|nr:hypothetical protein [Planctomycetota bacterium]